MLTPEPRVLPLAGASLEALLRASIALVRQRQGKEAA
jgi:hypothetical protein